MNIYLTGFPSRRVPDTIVMQTYVELLRVPAESDAKAIATRKLSARMGYTAKIGIKVAFRGTADERSIVLTLG